MKTKAVLAVCDLDAAVAAIPDISRRHTEKCLMAQFANRITGQKVYGSTNNAVSFKEHSREDTYTFLVEGMESLVAKFDTGNYAEVRRHLPREVEFEILS